MKSPGRRPLRGSKFKRLVNSHIDDDPDPLLTDYALQRFLDKVQCLRASIKSQTDLDHVADQATSLDRQTTELHARLLRPDNTERQFYDRQVWRIRRAQIDALICGLHEAGHHLLAWPDDQSQRIECAAEADSFYSYRFCF
jgi:hypothetical protein